jgi:hypothetical protein
MTKLNIRKNTAQFFRLAAGAVEQAKVPDIKLPTADQVAKARLAAKEKVREYRIRAAALVMPQDVVLVVESDKL